MTLLDSIQGGIRPFRIDVPQTAPSPDSRGGVSSGACGPLAGVRASVRASRRCRLASLRDFLASSFCLLAYS